MRRALLHFARQASRARSAPVTRSFCYASLSEAQCKLDDLRGMVEQETSLDSYPRATTVSGNALIYEADSLDFSDEKALRALETEWAHALLHGPGLVAITGAFSDVGAVDDVTAAFNKIIAAEAAGGTVAADHFAKAGANSRIWNAFEKLALHDSVAWTRYYDNDVLAAICRAWLGPGYQITSQVNVVHPGGEAQSPHCDYHLGFRTVQEAERFPAHTHALAPLLVRGACFEMR